MSDEDLRERDDHDDDRSDRSDTEDDDDDKTSLEDDSPPVETAYDRNCSEELGQVSMYVRDFSTQGLLLASQFSSAKMAQAAVNS